MTPRSCGYGDVTATCICRSEMPSRIYAKYQYRQESECGSTVVIYIPTEKYRYMVITESDIILQEYYITRKYKRTIYKEIYITKAERCSQQQERPREPIRRGTGRKSGDDPSFCCIPIVTEGSIAYSDQLQQGHQGPVSRIWT